MSTVYDCTGGFLNNLSQIIQIHLISFFVLEYSRYVYEIIFTEHISFHNLAKEIKDIQSTYLFSSTNI